MSVDAPSPSRSAESARVVGINCPPQNRGRRESRVPIAPMGPVQKKHGGRTTGSTGITPAFPAQWFTAYSALSLVTGLSCHHRQRDAKHHRQLDASVGASGPHDFAVRTQRHSSVDVARVHRLPPDVRDDAYAPLLGGMATNIFLIWVGPKQIYFLQQDWTGGIKLNSFSNSLFSREGLRRLRRSRSRSRRQPAPIVP